MTTIDLIAQEHLRYLASAKKRRDRIRYLSAVQRLRTQREGAAAAASAQADRRKAGKRK